MRKVKIIHLLCHLPNPVILNYQNPEDYFTSTDLGSYQRIPEKPYWVGFFSQDHHALAAKYLINITDEFEVECWRPYGYGIKNMYSERVDGLLHKVFPAKFYNFPQFGSITWSSSLYRELIKEIKKNNIILNISVGHAWFHIILMLKLRKFKKKFGIVAIHRSGGFRKFSFNNLPFWKKMIKWYYLIESYIDLKSLKIADYYFIGAKPEADYLKKYHNDVKSEFLVEGIDFTKYCVLSPEGKQNLREKLNLPLNKILILAYGNWRSDDYGYHHLLDVYEKIKKSTQNDHIQLVMIGGYKTEDLYERGLKAEAIMIERVPKNLFIKYLEASDIFLQTSYNWGFINYGGFGIAMTEALACGLPVISGNIIHFPGSDEELKQIGMDLPDKTALANNIIEMASNLSSYSNCRAIAQKYYDLNKTQMQILNKYREIVNSYFK